MYTCIVKFKTNSFTKYRNVKSPINLKKWLIRNNKSFYFITVYNAKTRNKEYILKQ